MKKYIGTKLIEAELQTRNNVLGYKVVYEDGYVSWSPKEVFEKAYMEVIPNKLYPKIQTDTSISQEMVDNFIKEVKVSTIGDKTTLVMVTLVNGFVIGETSACVDKENYSEEIGGEVCLKKIKDEIWMLLGFLLQTAVKGIKK